MASGRPAIAIMSEDTEVSMTLRQFRCGVTIPPKDAGALADAVNWFAGNETERIKMGRRARNAFLANYTVDICAEQYAGLFAKIQNQKSTTIG